MVTTVTLLPKVKEFLEEKKHLLFINGEFVESVSGKTFPTINPATEEVITEVSEAQKEDIDLAVRAARKALEGSWQKLNSSERGQLLHKLADLIERDLEELAQLESLDCGKPVKDARLYDLPSTIDCFRYYAGWATKIHGQTIQIAPNQFNYTKHEPVGVVGAIIPWNFPLIMLAWKLAPALAVGCTVVLKPAEQTPLTALYVAKLVQEAGFPEGVINIVPGYGETAGEALVAHGLVDKIAFTGSTAVGKHIMKTASSNVKSLTLELGGKSPNIILPDADLSKAVPGSFFGIMANSGQACAAASRLFVHKSIFDKVISEFSSLIDKVKLGPGLDESTELGPLVSAEQKERVLGYIESGLAEGATIAKEGKINHDKGYFVKPTIFTNVNENMKIVKEEIFGPVVVAMPFDDIDEVIERANNTQYGLASGVWTQDLKKAHYVIDRLKAGTVWVNSYQAFNSAAPFGGYKQSGIGRELGSYALDNYTEVKNVWISLD